MFRDSHVGTKIDIWSVGFTVLGSEGVGFA